MLKKIKETLGLIIAVLLILAIISVVFSAIKLGLVLWFWIILAVWILVFMLYFLTAIFKVVFYFWVVFAIWFIFSFLVSFGVILDASSYSSNSAANLPVVNGVSLSDCTSTATDTPVMLNGWKVTIFSHPLASTTAAVSEANNVKTFSYKGITDKTEQNTMRTRFEKVDGSYITGVATMMEVCNQDNKANYSYVTKSDNKRGASENVVASENYFHGGRYLFGAGTYRIDAYIFDAGKWHLVDRMSGIEVIE